VAPTELYARNQQPSTPYQLGGTSMSRLRLRISFPTRPPLTTIAQVQSPLSRFPRIDRGRQPAPAYLDRQDALGRERFLKTGSGRRFLMKQLTHYFRNNPFRTAWLRPEIRRAFTRTMIYTHVLNKPGFGVCSPLDDDNPSRPARSTHLLSRDRLKNVRL
jgi:hypothetical protein